MIKSQLFEVQFSENLTKQKIENFINQKKIDVVKWAIVGKNDNFIKLLISFEVNL